MGKLKLDICGNRHMAHTSFQFPQFSLTPLFGYRPRTDFYS